MPSFLEFIIFENTHEHVLEHVLEHEVDFNLAKPLSVKKSYSDPKIYTWNMNLNKRWYVYFSFRNPETGKLQRMNNIYGNAHQYKTKGDRMAVLTRYRSRLLKLLKLGFNPFKDNLDLFLEMKQKSIEDMEKPGASKKPKKAPLRVEAPKVESKNDDPETLIENAFNDVVERKKRLVNDAVNFPKNRAVNNSNLLALNSNYHHEKQQV